ncbi:MULTISPECIES: ABC transporter ATP-binding protein [Hyphomonas]|uniref:ABC transporter ATP-binding protein n=2 Tax=Hyphomonas adhaerens TaxID=81029 RepID=A0A069E6V3_9PROT|nr:MULTISPECIES: ABC transporter ATP-binding protein [Hyphomonas]KCZ83372.1 ABC transporter ATP-binding protein [Hyphomonas adhaerens MHS-3]MBB38626.1 ABC transporter ATP-binding protein [Hyphomonas sp.]HAE26821.1 ABC transporter ATP-binding protein [Hyphomonas adhaerens]|tara:strand:- start:1542 stop:2231 length:690 start_codon:yes stop_codon:yes gene_type:complete
MTVPVLELLGIKRVYKTAAGELNVLSDADLKLQAGELVGLIGPSGSGKSTLLHTAGLLERPEAGAVLLDGIDCLKLDDKARTAMRRSKIGFVYQFHHLLPEFNAADNVAMPLMIAGVSRKAARETALELLAEMGLDHRADHQPGQMSGGEQQRVAIARALANTPRLVIADEPTGNLDPATTARVFATFIKMAREEGASVLVATHNHALTTHMDRVLTLEDGKLVPYEPE